MAYHKKARRFNAGFFYSVIIIMVVSEKSLDVVTRTLFYLDIYFPDIFTYRADSYQQHATQEPQGKHQGGPPFDRTSHEEGNEGIDGHDERNEKDKKSHR